MSNPKCSVTMEFNKQTYVVVYNILLYITLRDNRIELARLLLNIVYYINSSICNHMCVRACACACACDYLNYFHNSDPIPVNI